MRAPDDDQGGDCPPRCGVPLELGCVGVREAELESLFGRVVGAVQQDRDHDCSGAVPEPRQDHAAADQAEQESSGYGWFVGEEQGQVPDGVGNAQNEHRHKGPRQLASDLTKLAVEQAEREARAMAEERTRIARELHDVVAHSVTVLVIQVGSARMLIDNAPGRAQSQLLAAERSGREALGELRRLLSVLRPGQAVPGADAPSVAPQPALDDLPALVASFRDAGMRLSVDVDAGTDDVPPGLGLTVYRIVQEGLTNALKHAPGAEVDVRVEVRPDAVRVDVVNGCSPTPSQPGSGYGLQGLRERVALYQGSYHAGPRADGWEVRVVLPRAAADVTPARQYR